MLRSFLRPLRQGAMFGHTKRSRCSSLLSYERKACITACKCRRWNTTLTERPPEETESDKKQSGGIWNTVTSWFGPDRQIVGAVATYDKIVAHSQNPKFYEVCRINDDFMGLVSVISLHVWMVHTRIKSDAYDQKGFVHHLYEQLWMDVEQRLKDEGISVWLISKHLKEVQQVVIGTMMTYDVTFQTFQKTEDSKPFLGALWRNVYGADVELDRANLIQLRDYVLQELDTVMYTHEDLFYAGKMDWSPPPSEKPRATEESASLDIALAQNIMFSQDDKFGTWNS